MGIDNPGATSTPTAVPILRGRKGIKDAHSIQSPIDYSGEFLHEYNTSPSSNKKLPERSSSRSPGNSPRRRGENDYAKYKCIKGRVFHASESGDESQSDPDDTDEECADGSGDYAQQLNESGNFKLGTTGLLGVAAVLVVLSVIFFSKGNNQPENFRSARDLSQAFELLEQEFDSQNEDFWQSIKVAIQEVPVFNQPRSVIFLYEAKAQYTLGNILSRVSENALCYLTGCSNRAVVIEGSSLNTTKVVNDYGLIISKYREKLEKNGVMIVNNLENVPGICAQAFHSFCDDYNPLVPRALILFTIKVSKLPEGYPMQFLEQFLLNLWNDIGKDDKFYPLFTRISGTILLVKPE